MAIEMEWNRAKMVRRLYGGMRRLRILSGILLCICWQLFWPMTLLAAPLGADAADEAVLVLVNRERERLGVPLLVMDDRLVWTARLRSEEVMRQFSHTRPNGQRCFTLLAAQGVDYHFAGENLVRGVSLTPKRAVRQWLASPAHYHNICRVQYSRTGIVHQRSADGMVYWVQVFLAE